MDWTIVILIIVLAKYCIITIFSSKSLLIILFVFLPFAVPVALAYTSMCTLYEQNICWSEINFKRGE